MLDILLMNKNNPKYSKLFESIESVPKWCNYDDICLAQYFHMSMYLLISYCLSIFTLVGGFGCPSINKVLISSRYWANNNNNKSLFHTFNRLKETGVWIYLMMKDISQLKPYGNAWKAILKVRLLHSKIRYQLLNSKSKWDTNEIPINQLQLIGTLLGFQYNPLLVINTVFGIPLTNVDRERYTLLWKYIGYYLGITYTGMIIFDL